MNILKYLKSEINETMQLSELVDVFEKMCQIPIEADMILFETGTFSFSDQPMFYFSLARQYPNGEEEYFQLHLDIQYKPSNKNKLFSGSIWNEDIGEDFFSFVRNSDAYLSMKNEKIAKIDIYMDET